jgi:hypothetical protein
MRPDQEDPRPVRRLEADNDAKQAVEMLDAQMVKW